MSALGHLRTFRDVRTMFALPPKADIENRERDRRTAEALRTAGWRILNVWECSLRGPSRSRPEQIVKSCVAFLGGLQAEVQLQSMSGSKKIRLSKSAQRNLADDRSPNKS
jgi:hypothetical protein